LPKYRDDIDELVNYIANPSKKNPEYPPMPNLGLSMDDVGAVARYLMEEVLGEMTEGEDPSEDLSSPVEE
jgi:hypothetical protein